MSIRVRKFEEKDMESMVSIWNEVVEEGVAYPQLDLLDEKTGPALFGRQTYCGVAEEMDSGQIFSQRKAYRGTAGKGQPGTGEKLRIQDSAVQCCS